MAKLPDDLLERLDPADREKTLGWWDSLSPAAQREFCRTWDARAEDTALHGVCVDGEIEWHPIPIELRAELVDEDEREQSEGRRDLLEYICGHAEVHFFLTERTFHICRSHAAARAAIGAGLLPRAFVCPLADTSCPIRAVLDRFPGRSIRLRPGLRRRDSARG